MRGQRPHLGPSGDIRGGVLLVLSAFVMGTVQLYSVRALLNALGPGLFTSAYATSAARYTRAVAAFGALWASVFLPQTWTPLCVTDLIVRPTRQPPARVTVLTDGALPVPFPCATPDCRSQLISSFRCGPGLPRTETVVLSGHSLPPLYLGLSPDALAERIACLDPQLLVLDTCYGFSAPLLDALVARGVSAVVVGPREQIAYSGLRYGGRWLEEPDPVRRAAAISASTGHPLQVWTLDGAELQRAHALCRSFTPAQLETRLKRVHPNLIDIPLKTDVSALFLIPAERFAPRTQ